ncbi:hypothetical protein [Pyxidicoccus caerfyrddinensis]|uniref:hypothetical protein n=1 Tax=Pyxidicoccus caerfyrddinensis TaxID=2709663 RepID=UPI0013DA709B|nr:hypothetical protein [Pyxidicoccus caerfyrddinensis]
MAGEMTEQEKQDAVNSLFEGPQRKQRPAKWPRALAKDLLASVECYGEPKDWPEGLYELLQLAVKNDPTDA